VGYGLYLPFIRVVYLFYLGCVQEALSSRNCHESKFVPRAFRPGHIKHSDK